MTQEKTGKFEYVILTATIFLVVFGLLVLFSASSTYSLKTYGTSSYLVIRQSIFCGIGFLLMLFISFIPYKAYIHIVKYIFLACLILIIVTTFAGRISRGTSRWIEIRGLIFQPSELMKLTMILYLSKILAETYGKLDDREKFLKVMIIAYVPTFIVALNNLSTGIILFLIATLMIFVISKKYLIFVFLLTLIVLFYIFAYPMSKVLFNVGLLKKYQVGRFFAWKDPENYPDLAYQTIQSLNALGSGKFFGRGYLGSIQKANIPEAHNDMIFSVLCEELGFIGAMIFSVLYIILLVRIFYLAYKQKGITCTLILFGIGVHIALQIILNIGVVTNLLPNTGVTLPFVSYGGSSLMVLFIEIGIIMSIARYSERV